MNDQPLVTFSSRQPHVIRNAQVGYVLCFLIIVSMVASYFNLSLIIRIVPYVCIILILRNTYKLKEEKSVIIYNLLEVYDDYLKFVILKKNGAKTKTVKVDLSSLQSVTVKNVKIDSIVDSRTVKIIEFKGMFDRSRMLRYDIEGREQFEQLLKGKGFKIEYKEAVEKLEDTIAAVVEAPEDQKEETRKEKVPIEKVVKEEPPRQVIENGTEQKQETEYTKDSYGNPLFSHRILPFSLKKGIILASIIVCIGAVFLIPFFANIGKTPPSFEAIIESFMNSSFLCLVFCLVGYFCRWVFGKNNSHIDIRWVHSIALMSLCVLVFTTFIYFTFLD